MEMLDETVKEGEMAMIYTFDGHHPITFLLPFEPPTSASTQVAAHR